ncbi:hypothetical protein TRIUR3_32293 [Triticum urartu]|uniref:Uncharacterized protein n=1 Tax=Triticum urartu TaxID=4572 RepID=M8A7E2_TRIUA|nr:hypothetical protein TRIUR3_32293 [Triticum urartu]
MWSVGGGGGSSTVQAPLQFMSTRVNYPGSAGAMGGMPDTNIGMLAGLNAYDRGGGGGGGTEEEQQQQQQEQDQQQEMEQQRDGSGGGNEGEEDGDDDSGGEEEGHGDNSSHAPPYGLVIHGWHLIGSTQGIPDPNQIVLAKTHVLSFLGNDSNVHEIMMLSKLDTFVLLTNEGPSLEKDEHWSKNTHGVDGMRKGIKNGVTSDDFRTLKPP